MKRILCFATISLLAVGCSCDKPEHKDNQYPAHNRTSDRSTERAPYNDRGDFVGARGADGPQGATGAQGPTGQTGEAGYAMAGPRGADGPAGPAGEQGRTGARGPSGDLQRGVVGNTGRAGNTGEQGAQGATGARGASAEGYAGPAGPAGQAGPQGPMGESGSKGPTLVGPTGRAGRSGTGGEAGGSGETGNQGKTTPGVAGAVGAAGGAGPQGDMGNTGGQGRVGYLERWASYRFFNFEAGSASYAGSDAIKITDIAAYMKENPSMQIGLDSSVRPLATDQNTKDLADRRVKTVRDALVSAGVPNDRIVEGQFGDNESRSERRVEALIRSTKITTAQ